MEEKNYGYIKNHINSLVLKLTNFCNEECNYCYRENDVIDVKKIMEDEIIYKTIESYLEFLCKSNSDKNYIHMIWHGGEPLLAGIDKFKKIVEIENDFNKKSGIKFINEVQTNGLLINEEWANFFEINKFYVEISLQSPNNTQKTNTSKGDDKSIFTRAMEGIELLKKHDINLNIVSSVSNEGSVDAKEIYSFVKKIGIHDVDFIPCFCHVEDNDLEKENYNFFIEKILEMWRNDDFDLLNIRFLNDLKSKIKTITLQEEAMTGTAKSWEHNFSIGVDGEIYPCGNLTPIKAFYVGNIKNDSFEKRLKSNEFEAFKSLFDCIDPECFKCEEHLVYQKGLLDKKTINNNLFHEKKSEENSKKKVIIKMMKVCYNRVNSECKNM